MKFVASLILALAMAADACHPGGTDQANCETCCAYCGECAEECGVGFCPAPTGGICFNGDAAVSLEGGKTKAIRDLGVGETILTADRDGALTFKPVVFLPHKTNNVARKFERLTTASGKELFATMKHLLPDCKGALKTARDFTAGDCVRTADGEETLAAVARDVDSTGVYTAVTTNEFLVVGGIVASPFSEAHGVAHAAFNATDVAAWCEANGALVALAEHEGVQELVTESRRRRLTAGAGPTPGASADAKICVETLASMAATYENHNVGWGADGWGYKNFDRRAKFTAAALAGWH